MRTNWPLLFLLIAATGGCAHHDAERREVRGEPAVAGRAGWVMLGERSVDGVRDRDVITVGAREGRYRRIMLVVENSALELFDVVVTFGNGTHFEPHTRHVFGPQTRSSVIDLPGDARFIRSVEFRYGNLPGGGRARMELWAQ
jgi:hypothetical protein